MKRTMKQILCMTLSILLLISLLSAGAMAVDTVKVYCQTSSDWKGCYVYWWDSSLGSISWPGVMMYKEYDGFWYYEVPADASGLIFHNNAGTQSCDLKMPTEDRAVYDFVNQAWKPQFRPVKWWYSVAGSADLCGVAWDPGAFQNRMTMNEDGSHSITYTNIPAGNYELKVTDGTWSNCWGADGGMENYLLTVEQDGSTVVITFDPETCLIESEVYTSGSTVYCMVPGSWNECYLYTWNDVDFYLNGQWPGTRMTEVSGGLWCGVADPEATCLVFSSDSGLQTMDLQMPTDDRVVYDVENQTWDVLKPGPLTPEQIVNAAYGLEVGETLEDPYTLTGRVISVDESYSSAYQNITVTIEVEGCQDRPIRCYRMKGGQADIVSLGDVITVTGYLTNFRGTVQFATGCSLDHIGGGGSGHQGFDGVALIGWGLPGSADMGELGGVVYLEPIDMMWPYAYQTILNCPAGTDLVFSIINGTFGETPIIFGGADIVLGETVWMEYGADATDMHLHLEEECALRVIADFSGFDRGEPAMLRVEKKSEPVPYRTLTVFAPSTWSSVWAYTWYPESFGLWPGTELTDLGEFYQIRIPLHMVNLMLNGTLPDGSREMTYDIFLEDNDQDVLIRVTEEGNAMVSYSGVYTGTFRVVGNTDWMGNWDSASNAGLLEETVPGVYQKCFKDVEPGRYEFKITRDGKWDDAVDNNGNNFCFTMAARGDVTVTLTFRNGEPVVELDYDRPIMGDVSGDGKLNLGDVARLYTHLRGSRPLTDAAALSVADFNGDGNINIGDTARLYAYLRGMDPAGIVDAAYRLEENQEMHYDVTLTGRVIAVKDAYDPQYQNITVVIQVSGRETKPIICYRLQGEGVERIAVSDVITVEGRLRNYDGTVEMYRCTMTKRDYARG